MPNVVMRWCEWKEINGIIIPCLLCRIVALAQGYMLRLCISCRLCLVTDLIKASAGFDPDDTSQHPAHVCVSYGARGILIGLSRSSRWSYAESGPKALLQYKLFYRSGHYFPPESVRVALRSCSKAATGEHGGISMLVHSSCRWHIDAGAFIIIRIYASYFPIRAVTDTTLQVIYTDYGVCVWTTSAHVAMLSGSVAVLVMLCKA